MAAKKHAVHKHLVLKKTSSGKSRWVNPKAEVKKKPTKKTKEKAGIWSSFSHLKGGAHERHSPSDGHTYVQHQRAKIAKLRKEGKHAEAAHKQATLDRYMRRARNAKN
jgi:hypothetical protein